MTQKKRLDNYIQQTYCYQSLSEAQSIIIQGFIFINDQKKTKPGTLISAHDTIENRYQRPQYVSRGGLKLEGAFQTFKLSCQNKHCLDIGLSTGGFTDYLIQQKASHVTGIDVAYGKVDTTIRNHPQTTIIERQNARTFQIPKSTTPITLVVMDVSFIAVHKILINIIDQLSDQTDYIILIKPQFEGKKELIPPGGVIKDPKVITTILKKTTQQLQSIGLTKIKTCKSPITGNKGNQEYFFWLKKHTNPS